MEEIKINNNKNEYTMKTTEGQAKIREFVECYNKNINELDPLSKKIGIEEGLALTNVEEFIRNKSQVAEIVREAIEIGFTTKNFRTNTIFTFTRNKLKKAGYNSLIRMQIENYIKFRLHLTDKAVNSNENDIKYKNITSFSINGEILYYNILTDTELTEKEIKEYLNYKKEKQIA